MSTLRVLAVLVLIAGCVRPKKIPDWLTIVAVAVVTYGQIQLGNAAWAAIDGVVLGIWLSDPLTALIRRSVRWYLANNEAHR